MHNKVIIGIIAVLVLLGVPFLVIKSIERETEKQVAQALEQQKISAKLIKYNLLEDTLSIHDLTVKFAFLPNSVFMVDEVIISEPNKDALNPKALGRPLVAKQITLNNIHGTYNIQERLNNFHIKNLSIDNWAQNLGKVAELATKGFNEAFFSAVFDVSIDKIEYTGFSETGQLDIDNIPFSSKGKIASISMEKMNSTKVGSYTLKDLDYTYDNNQGVKIVSYLGEFSWERVNLPTPGFWALVMEILPNILNNSLTEAQKMRLLTYVESGMKLFANTKFGMNDVNLTLHDGIDTKNLLSLQNANLETDFDLEKYTKARLSTSLSGVGIDIKYLDLNTKDEAIFSELLGRILAVDAAFTLDLATNQEPSSLDISLGLQNVGHSEGKIQVILPEEVLPKLLASGKSQLFNITEQDLQKWALSTLIVSAEAAYKDVGLFPNTLAFASKQTKQSVEAIWQKTSQELAYVLRTHLPNFGAENSKAIQQCFRNPGTLKLSSTPAQPMNAETTAKTFIVNPELLNFAITCTPGKDILASTKEPNPSEETFGDILKQLDGN